MVLRPPILVADATPCDPGGRGVAGFARSSVLFDPLAKRFVARSRRDSVGGAAHQEMGVERDFLAFAALGLHRLVCGYLGLRIGALVARPAAAARRTAPVGFALRCRQTAALDSHQPVLAHWSVDSTRGLEELMNDSHTSEAAHCAVCGAWAEVRSGALQGYKLRDAQLCKVPPIEDCPNMLAAINRAKPKR